MSLRVEGILMVMTGDPLAALSLSPSTALTMSMSSEASSLLDGLDGWGGLGDEDEEEEEEEEESTALLCCDDSPLSLPAPPSLPARVDLTMPLISLTGGPTRRSAVASSPASVLLLAFAFAIFS